VVLPTLTGHFCNRLLDRLAPHKDRLAAVLTTLKFLPILLFVFMQAADFLFFLNYFPAS
jgi:hypothetical protein